MRTMSKRVLLALTSVLALAAMTTAAASAALPEFSGATFPVSYAMTTSHHEVHFYSNETTAYVVCEGGGEASGQITGAKTLTAKFAFHGCKAVGVGGTVTCTTKGATSGEIRSETVQGAPVYTAKASKAVGIDFNIYEPKKLGIPTFADFSCAEFKFQTRSGMIAPVTSLNKPATSYALNFKVDSSRIQTPALFENEAGETVRNVLGITWPSEAFFAEGGMTAETTLLTAKSIEVKG
jgi:hypothetical protein